MEETTPRYNWIDSAKGIAILTVVIGHVGMFGVSQIPLAFQLELFAIVSGYLLKPGQRPLSFLQKKSSRFLLPYLLASVIALVFWLFFLATSQVFANLEFVPNTILSYFLIGGNIIYNAPLWFLPSYLIAHLLWIFWSNRFTNHSIISSLIGIVCFFVIGFALSDPLHAVFGSLPIPYTIDLAFVLAAYIGIGTLARKIDLPKKVPLAAVISCAILFFIGARINCVVNFYGRVNGSLGLMIFNSLTGSATVLLLCLWLERQSIVLLRRLDEISQFLGKRSIDILVYHWPSLLLLNWILFTSGVLASLGATVNLVSVSVSSSHTLYAVGVKITLFVLYVCWGVVLSLAIGSSVSKLFAPIKNLYRILLLYVQPRRHGRDI